MDFALHRNLSDLVPLAKDWNMLLAESITPIPFLRYEYLSAWWTTRGGGEWPESELAVVTAHQGGRLVGIAPLFSSRNRTGDPALLLLGSIEISDYLDILVRPADLSEFLAGFLDFIAQSGLLKWQLLDLHNFPEASPTLPALKAEAEKRGWTFTQERTYHVPSIPLAGNFETYLAGIDKKQRHEIRRKMRRAEASARNVRWYIVEDGSSLDVEVEAFLELMAEDSEKAAFLTVPMREQMRLTCQAAFDYGWLQLAFLEADGQKAAGYLNFDYLNRIWVYNSGISRHFLDISAGWVLLAYLLQWANEKKRTEFDFMRGNEDYKYRFGGMDKYVIRAKVMR
ncbi:MAG: GNAT family N-acetyltransferase [Anaerolineales bacterium]|jgi:CelD/BcsL family acetyltransferase involved in cellulose biosynthesis